MDDLTLPQMAKKLEKYIMTLPASKKFNTLSPEPRKAMIALNEAVFQLRINCEKYFSADDSEEQVIFLDEAVIQAEKTNELVLTASQYDLLGAADVAQLSAIAVSIKDRLG